MTIRLFSRRGGEAPGQAAETFPVVVGDRAVTVTVRRDARARRYVLRLAVRGDGAVVTVPLRGSLAGAKAFVGRYADWLAERLVSRPAVPAIPETVPLRGRACRVVMTGASRGLARLEESEGAARSHLPGETAHLRRRLVDHLKKEARVDLDRAVARHAAALGVRPAAVHIRDTTFALGFGRPRRTLSFSWRLIMAPGFVLDYVAAHEVAHLAEINHSPRFWEICRRLAPRCDEAKAWLAAHGAELHRAI